MAKTSKSKTVIRADIMQLARLSRDLVPATEMASFDRYTSHLGRGEYEKAHQIAKDRTRPQLWAGSSPLTYRNVYQAYSWTFKLTIDGDARSEDKGWTKFLASEELCRSTNRRIRRFTSRFITTYDRAPSASALIEKVRKRVHEIMGGLTLPVYQKLVSEVHFGPGMTQSSADHKKVTAPFKLSDLPTVTTAARSVWLDVISNQNHEEWWEPTVNEAGELRVQPRVREVPGCSFTFVPKSADEKRTIAIEPSGNMSAQLSVHKHLVRRLKAFGVDLRDQTRNRRLALQGSLDGTLATIDLSSASDCVAYELVRLLVPREWFLLLDALRSPIGSHRGNTVVLEKFSSMGNGYTFALETVIFKAIVDSVVADDAAITAVYGDDIIVPSSDFSPMRRALRFFGFKLNLEKSFSEGPFRESCGLDAFDGVDVRPIFLRRLDMSTVQAVALHNHLYPTFPRLAKAVAGWFPESQLLYGPPRTGATYLFTEDRVLLGKHRRWNEDWQCHTYLSFTEKAVLTQFPIRYRYLAALYHGGNYSRGAPMRYSTKLVKCVTPG